MAISAVDVAFRRLDVRPDESHRVVLYTLYIFGTVASMILAKTARDTFFLSRYDPALLPWMFIASAVAIALVVSLYRRAGRQIEPVRLVQGSWLIFVLSLPLFSISSAGWTYGSF